MLLMMLMLMMMMMMMGPHSGVGVRWEGLETSDPDNQVAGGGGGGGL